MLNDPKNRTIELLQDEVRELKVKLMDAETSRDGWKKAAESLSQGCAEMQGERDAARKELADKLAEIHKLVARGKGHGTTESTHSCIVSGILSLRMDLKEAEADLTELESLRQRQANAKTLFEQEVLDACRNAEVADDQALGLSFYRLDDEQRVCRAIQAWQRDEKS